MKPYCIRAWALLLVAVAFAGSDVRGAELAIIAKARAWLGTEDALNHVQSIRMEARIATSLSTDAKDVKPRSAQLEIIFRKPNQERITVIAPDAIQREALDNYNGWRLVQRRAPGEEAKFDAHKPQGLTILGAEEVQRLRAEALENLYFYRGIEEAGGEVVDMGPARADGVECEKVALRHSATIVYYRWFDLSTGRLVYTETAAGARIHEEGEIVVEGVKFPREITLQEDAAGKTQTTHVTVSRVTLNGNYPDAMFGTPPPPLPIARPVPTAPAAAAAPDAGPGAQAAPSTASASGGAKAQ